MIAAVNSAPSIPFPQAQPQPATAPGLVPTIERYRAARDRQRKLEADARREKKEADTLETALTDATEKSGGMLAAGPYVLGFEWKDGTPSYKSICEDLIRDFDLPAETLLERTADTPPRRVLVIA
jgi:hypothetical protein